MDNQENRNTRFIACSCLTMKYFSYRLLQNIEVKILLFFITSVNKTNPYQFFSFIDSVIAKHYLNYNYENPHSVYSYMNFLFFVTHPYLYLIKICNNRFKKSNSLTFRHIKHYTAVSSHFDSCTVF